MDFFRFFEVYFLPPPQKKKKFKHRKICPKNMGWLGMDILDELYVVLFVGFGTRYQVVVFFAVFFFSTLGCE